MDGFAEEGSSTPPAPRDAVPLSSNHCSLGPVHRRALRAAAIEVASRHLRPLRNDDLYIDRGICETMLGYLEGDDFSAFPLIGPAGAGKTWELRNLLCRLPERFIPIYVNARLAASPLSDIGSQLESMARRLRLPSGGELSDIAWGLVPHATIVVLLDGVNELQLTQDDEGTFRRLIWAVLTGLQRDRVKCIFASRTFTWQRSLTDSGFQDLMYVSGHQTITREIVVPERRDPWERDGRPETDVRFRITREEEQVPMFGAQLDPLTESQRAEFIGRLANVSGDNLLLPPGSDLFDLIADPFYAGLVAGQVLQSRSLANSAEDLMETYIRSRCIDKGTSHDGDGRYLALINLTSLFYLPSSSLRTFVRASEAREAIGSQPLLSLLNSGILSDETLTADRERVVLFRHDRVFEYCISRNIIRSHRNNGGVDPEQLAFISHLIIRRAAGDRRDYWLRIANLLLRAQGADLDLNASAGAAWFAAQVALRDVRLTRSATDMFIDVLGDANYGYAVADLLRLNGDTAAIDAFLAQVDANGGQELLRNAVIVAKSGSASVRRQLLQRLASTLDALLALRVAFAIGELRLRDARSILNTILANHNGDNRVRSAVQWAVGRLE